MLNFFRANKKELTVTLDRQNSTYFPGETVVGTIELTADKALKLGGVTAVLSGTEEYKYRYITYDTDPEGNSTQDYRTSWGRNQFFASQQSILGETVLTGGTTHCYQFQLMLPSDAPPTCAGALLRVRWQLNVVADRPRARDMNTDIALLVHSQDLSQDRNPSEYGQSNRPDEAELTFILPGLGAVVGQQLAGQLHILPRKEFDSKVRLELVRREYVPYDQGNSSEKSYRFELVGRTSFVSGRPQVLPFELAIPADAPPSVRTSNGTISWKLRGVLDRSLRKDTVVEQNLEIYSA